MTFAWPLILWCLLAPLGLLIWELRRRDASTDQTHPNILQAEAGRTSVTLTSQAAKTRRTRPRYWCVAGLALCIVALARPQWGRLDEPVFEQAREILIAMDLSRSMLTQDVKPSRLERSKLLVQSLLDRLQGERVGLLVFSGTSFLQAPMSADYEVLREFLPNLGPDYMPEGGTNYHDLLKQAVDAFGTGGAADRYLIILSDGEATDDAWHDPVPELQKRNVRVIGLGVGTADGGMIPDKEGSFLKDDTGAVVKSHLESATLKELASATHGVYRDASSWVDLAEIVHATVDQGSKGAFLERNDVRLVERFQWVLAPALLCLLLSLWREFPVKPRVRSVALKSAVAPAAKAAAMLILLIGLTSALKADTPVSSPGDLLGSIVTRLSQKEAPTAQDWSEFAHQTVDWGTHIQEQKQPVPEGPVRDALMAADRGLEIDPKATDWNKLKDDLRRLLRNPENQKKDDQQKQDQQKDQKKNQQQDSQNSQSQKNQDQNSQKQDSQKQQQTQPDSQKGQSQQPQQDRQNQTDQQKEQGKQSGKNAFDFAKPQQPLSQPPQQGGTKQVGGVKDDKQYDPAQADPSLAVPLQKLDQIKNEDSPAQLYQLMRRGEPTPPPSNHGKNW